MRYKKLLTFALLGVLAAGSILAFASFYPALAQEETPAGPAEMPGRGNGFRHFGHGRGADGAGAEALAGALGISVDELTTAFQTAREAALAQAVEDGLITQAQADALLAREGVHPMGGRWGGWLSQNGVDFEAHLADALVIPVEELQEAYDEAYLARIEQAVEDGSLTREQADFLIGRHALSGSQDFLSSMQTAFQEAVRQAVEAGEITQAQADAILQHSAEGGFPGGRGFGGRRGPGGFGCRGGWGVGPEVPVEPQAPDTAVPSGL